MSDHDALIEMLNGFGDANNPKQFDTVVFLDEDGMPTDRFLQALKSDASMLPAFDDALIYSEEATHKLDEEFPTSPPGNSKSRSGGYRSAGMTQRASSPAVRSKDDLEMEYDALISEDAEVSRHVKFQDRQEEQGRAQSRQGQRQGAGYAGAHGSAGAGPGAGSRGSHFRDQGYAYEAYEDADYEQFDFDPEAPRGRGAGQGQMGQAQAQGQMGWQGREAREGREGQGGEGGKSTSTRLKEASKTKKKVVKRVPSAGSRRAKIDTGVPSLYSATASTASAALSGGRQSGEQHFPRAIGVDTTEVEVEAEGRVKAMQLRVQGQLQAIRSLEGQLGDALQLLESRNKQLAHCNARLKAAVTSRETSAGGAGAGVGVGVGVGLVKSDGKAEALAEQYKVQADFMQAKLATETGRRVRAEERARVLKSYSEKAKERCLGLESQNAELKGAVTEITARMEKFRRSYKDQASESVASKAALAEKEAELGKGRRSVEKAESALRNLQMALEHSKAELRNEKVHTQAARSKLKQLNLQISIQQEREATRRADLRLRDMEAHRGSAGIGAAGIGAAGGARAGLSDWEYGEYKGYGISDHEDSRGSEGLLRRHTASSKRDHAHGSHTSQHTSQSHAQSREYDDSVNAHIARAERNLDLDVVTGTQQQHLRRMGTQEMRASPPRRGPGTAQAQWEGDGQWRGETVHVRRSFNDFYDAVAQPAVPSGSASDAEVEARVRNRGPGHGGLGGGGGGGGTGIAGGEFRRGGEIDTVSFIRQRVVSGAAPLPARSRPPAPQASFPSFHVSDADSGASAELRSGPGGQQIIVDLQFPPPAASSEDTISLASGGGSSVGSSRIQFSRLQKLYDKVTKKPS